MSLAIKHASRVSTDTTPLVLSFKTCLPGFPGALGFPCQATYIAHQKCDDYLHWTTKLCGDIAVNHRPPFDTSYLLSLPQDLLSTGAQRIIKYLMTDVHFYNKWIKMAANFVCFVDKSLTE